MKTRFLHLFCSAAVALASILPLVPAQAQGEDTIIGGVTQATESTAVLPAGGISLVPTDGIFALKTTEKVAGSVELEEIVTQNQPFFRALRVTTKTQSSSADITLSAPTTTRFDEVDTVFVRLYMRTLQSAALDGYGSLKINVEQNSSPIGRSFYAGTVRSRPDQGWIRYDSPAAAMRGAGAGEARLEIQLGGAAQVIEIAGLEVLNYRRNLFAHQLPHRSGGTYEGREADAPWRKLAQERIEKFRKGDLVVQVQDAAGKPLAGAMVKVKMTRHAYGFGTAVNENQLIDRANTPDGQKYREILSTTFNQAVLESGHKWKTWDASPKNRERAIETTNWLREKGIAVRGHTLVWPGWANLPASLKTDYEATLAKDGEEAAKTLLRTRADAHIREVMAQFKGQFTDWDVINETTTNHALMDILGEDVLVDWFKIAREIEPKIPFYLNDFNNLTSEQKHTDNFERTAKMLLKNGAPLSGLGFQGHGNALSIPQVQANFERFAKLGLPMMVTEFDIVTPDEQLQADWTRDLMTLTFSQPQSAGFMLWGFWDGKHWLGDAPLFYPDWTLKPSGKAWLDLVQGAWKTDVSGQTMPNGEWKTRGFLGEYEITVSQGNKTKSIKATLTRQGLVLPVKF